MPSLLFAFASAPAASKTSMLPDVPLEAAQCSGVQSSSPRAMTLAPAANNALIFKSEPPEAAQCSGVQPLPPRAIASAPAVNKIWTLAAVLLTTA